MFNHDPISQSWSLEEIFLIETRVFDKIFVYNWKCQHIVLWQQGAKMTFVFDLKTLSSECLGLGQCWRWYAIVYLGPLFRRQRSFLGRCNRITAEGPVCKYANIFISRPVCIDRSELQKLWLTVRNAIEFASGGTRRGVGRLRRVNGNSTRRNHN